MRTACAPSPLYLARLPSSRPSSEFLFTQNRLAARGVGSETDYFEEGFQLSYWGAEKYPRLLRIKYEYDPEGLFVCRHCAGSEYWTEESNLNCRNESMWPPPRL